MNICSKYLKLQFGLIFFVCAVFFFPCSVSASSPLKVEYFYNQPCGPCDQNGQDFFAVYNNSVTEQEKELLNPDFSIYNIFANENRIHYQKTRQKLQIPDDTPLPVVTAGDSWLCFSEPSEEALHDFLMAQNASLTETAQNIADSGSSVSGVSLSPEAEAAAAELSSRIQNSKLPVLLLFTTESCESCEKVKSWISEERSDLKLNVLNYNIITDNCLELLQTLFDKYQVRTQDQKVPIAFLGDQFFAGTEIIPQLETLSSVPMEANEFLLKNIQDFRNTSTVSEKSNLLTLAGAGFLAGFNPCSVSMLLMLLSLVLSEKASVWKNGFCYLAGKYAAYFLLGTIIYLSASQLSAQVLQSTGRILDLIMTVLFGAAGILYLTDAVRVFRHDYGNIHTQLPVKLRRWNHRLIHRVSGSSGLMQPLMILGLGAAISFGEFFCTGQIYMASITYLLKNRASGVWLSFFVYVTAMSLPALFMILLIQKTRNTERISEFMLHKLGWIKLFNALLFFGFMLYFLIR